MIPRSTTITSEGRWIRSRIIWGAATAAVLLALAFAFVLFDRSTVVDGPTGSSFVTTATGLAALHDTLSRDGRQPVRLQQPLNRETLAGLDAYLVADVGFGRFAPSELDALVEFAADGGTVMILGVPPTTLIETFGVDVKWSGASGGLVPVRLALDNAREVDASRFGIFDTDHAGRVLAGSDQVHIAVVFPTGLGSVIFVADSAIAHNATVSDADNVDFLGDVLGGRIGFDEYRHGYDNTPAAGLVSAAPGNWPAALGIGGVVLVLALITYGRRFGPVEPRDRPLVPDRAAFVDSVARSLRRAKGELPTEPLRHAVTRQLGLPAGAPTEEIAAAARRAGTTDADLSGLDADGIARAYALDRILAAQFTQEGNRS